MPELYWQGYTVTSTNVLQIRTGKLDPPTFHGLTESHVFLGLAF